MRRVVWVSAGALFLALTLPRTAPATVAEQRARLPPPAVCTDPIAGIWKSHTYFPEHYTSWTEFTLEIRRVPGEEGALRGKITNHSWVGGPEAAQPPVCDDTLRYVVSMDAVGTVGEGGALAFGGVGDWRLDEVLCGRFTGGYNLDQFTGLVDQEIQEFQSVNNDGGISVDEPTVFRRVRCLSDAFEPTDAPPPPFFPPVGPGCSLW